MKQRLVGALVLGCLALIFIPLLLDGEGMSPPLASTALPSAPELPTLSVADPVRPVVMSDAGASTQTLTEAATESTADTTEDNSIDSTEENSDPAVAATNVPATTPQVATAVASETAPALGVNGLPEAWSVRFGSFGDRANAESLIKKLLDAGYKAYSRPVQSGQVTLTGVFVGPVLTRAEANTLAQEVPRKMQLNENGFVQRFQVDELGQ